MMRKVIAFFFLIGYILPATAGQLSDVDISTAAPATDTNAVLIFLDDSEQEELGSITRDFLAAFVQEAAPIIVSASLINNIRTAVVPEEKNPQKLMDMAEKIVNTSFYFDQQEQRKDKELFKNIVASTIDFDENATNNWIIKRINKFLYLLLPIKYLLNKQITKENASFYDPNLQLITPTEQILGLKINHLPSVEVSSISDPAAYDPYNPFASFRGFVNYFIDSLDAILLKTRDYTDPASAPSIGIYIEGHGMINRSICTLSLEQFKTFLSFLEKIKTKVLIYNSCYAAGTNERLIYRDAMAAIDKTYNFPIITMALTDAPTVMENSFLTLEQGKIKPKLSTNYNCFIKAITTSDIPHYSQAIQCINQIGRAHV